MLHDVMTALRAGDATAALAAAERWVAAEPANPEAFEWLAQAHGAAGDTAAAAAAIDRGLALAPGHAGLITTRAFLHLQGGDLEASTADFRAAVAEDPNQLPAYVALAHLALGRGDRAEAERLVALAKRIDDEHPRLLPPRPSSPSFPATASAPWPCSAPRCSAPRATRWPRPRSVWPTCSATTSPSPSRPCAMPSP
jgi:tetratricopeptide (TPR) repeat protein